MRLSAKYGYIYTFFIRVKIESHTDIISCVNKRRVELHSREATRNGSKCD